jgi:hypothetical protein
MMSKFLLSAHSVAGDVREPMTEEQMRHGYEAVGQLEAELRAADALVFGGRLESPTAARVARPSKGRVRMTDGPYAETKEQLGGIYLIDAPDLDAAISWAARVALVVGTDIEVRAFAMESAG